MSREVNLESFHHAELIRKRFPTVYFTAEFQHRLVQAAKEKGHAMKRILLATTIAAATLAGPALVERWRSGGSLEVTAIKITR